MCFWRGVEKVGGDGGVGFTVFGRVWEGGEVGIEVREGNAGVDEMLGV